MAALLGIAVSCATHAAPANVGPSADRSRAARNRNVITREELQDPVVASNDAMTTIRQLRPQYFLTRGPLSFKNASAGLVQISQDYGPLHAVSTLSSIDTRSLTQVRYLNSSEAQARFGINANGGPVIVLLTTNE
jgi:hypothetical protein